MIFFILLYNYACNCLVLKVVSESVACALEVLDGETIHSNGVKYLLSEYFYKTPLSATSLGNGIKEVAKTTQQLNKLHSMQ